MIVEFSVKNFRSIKEMQTISFVASNLKSAPEYEEVDQNNIVEIGGMRLLKTVGIYGPNSSGKSNIIKAFQYFINFVCLPVSPNPTKTNLHQPFLYQPDSNETESYFQIVFIVEDKKYRYGFTIKNNLVVNEWLYGTSAKNMVTYFIRNGSRGSIEIRESFKEAENIPTLEFEHNLFLTHVASFRNGEAYKIWNYLYLHSAPIDGRAAYRNLTVRMLNLKGDSRKDYSRKIFMNFYNSFGINYDGFEFEESFDDYDYTGEDYPVDKIYAIKRGQKLNMGIHESDGVLKIFDLSGYIINCFRKGGIMLQDELDSNFHPTLFIYLIKKFNGTQTNFANGQLLFTTHDTNLLDPAIMRRDQFYFTEKDSEDATKLYSLAELKGIRNDADFAKQYLSGFYGALPVLNNYIEEKEPSQNE